MVYEKVRAILADILTISEDDISLDSAVIEDLGADSLDIVDVLGTLGDEFDIEVDEDEMEKIKTVGDIVSFIEERI